MIYKLTLNVSPDDANLIRSALISRRQYFENKLVAHPDDSALVEQYGEERERADRLISQVERSWAAAWASQKGQ